MGCILCVFLFSATIAFIVFILFIFMVFLKASPYPDNKRSEKEKRFLDKKTNKHLDFPSITEPWSVHLTVVVPAYNEDQRLTPMLDESLEFLEKRKQVKSGFKYEIIVVSDGSTDKTVDVGHRYTEKYGSDVIRVLELNPNRGKGGAVQLGVMSSRGAVILFADADGATTFADIEKLEDSLKEVLNADYMTSPDDVCSKQAVIVGSRAHLEEESLVKRSFFRTFLMHGFHFLVWSLAVRTVRDTQCGFKMFTRRTAETLFSSVHVQRWAFDVELLYLAELFNIPMTEIAVNWTEIDGSKIVPVFSWLQMGRDLLLIWLRYKIGAWKIASKP